MKEIENQQLFSRRKTLKMGVGGMIASRHPQQALDIISSVRTNPEPVIEIENNGDIASLINTCEGILSANNSAYTPDEFYYEEPFLNAKHTFTWENGESVTVEVSKRENISDPYRFFDVTYISDDLAAGVNASIDEPSLTRYQYSNIAFKVSMSEDFDEALWTHVAITDGIAIAGKGEIEPSQLNKVLMSLQKNGTTPEALLELNNLFRIPQMVSMRDEIRKIIDSGGKAKDIDNFVKGFKQRSLPSPSQLLEFASDAYDMFDSLQSEASGSIALDGTEDDVRFILEGSEFDSVYPELGQGQENDSEQMTIPALPDPNESEKPITFARIPWRTKRSSI